MNQVCKALLVLLVAIVAVSIGNVLLSLGQKPPAPEAAIPHWVRSLSQLGRWPLIILGTCGHATFFFLLLWVLSWADLSFAQPVTALNFALTAAGACWLLREPVDGMRWLGIALVVVGVALISWSGKETVLPPAAPPAVTKSVDH